uniref:Uncharacterized protein n=1 Tax=Bactrocera latifrons TaxID=174628 RepID=A0A0K8VB54_BACLA
MHSILLSPLHRITTLTPKLGKHIRGRIENILRKLIETAQTHIISKFTICEPPHFDTTGLLHSKRLYGPRVSILVDECGAPSIEGDVDNYEHVLKVTTHNDALYAYYYTDDLTNKVKVTEIFEIDEEEKLAVDPKLFEGIVEDHPNPRQHHHNVVSEWNGVESVQVIPSIPQSREDIF